MKRLLYNKFFYFWLTVAIGLGAFFVYASNLVIDNGFDNSNLGPITVNTLPGDKIVKVLTQPDGKFIVTQEYNGDFTHIRFNNDGTVDNGFDLSGSGIRDIVGLWSGYIWGRDFDMVDIIRRNYDGSVDNSFDASWTSLGDVPFLIGVQSNGRAIVTGELWSLDNRNIIRLPLDGGGDGSLVPLGDHISSYLDTDFGPIRISGDQGDFTNLGDYHDFWLLYESSYDFDYPTLFVQPDDKIVISGKPSINYRVNTDLHYGNGIRLNPDGTLDETFDLPFIPLGLSILSNGKFFATEMYDSCVLYRLNEDGSLDESFDPVSLDAGGDLGCVRYWVDNNDRILYRSSVDTITRLTPNGEFDTEIEFLSGILDYYLDNDFEIENQIDLQVVNILFAGDKMLLHTSLWMCQFDDVLCGGESQIYDENLFLFSIHHPLTYHPSSFGTISGSSTQTVTEGEDGTQIEAIPNEGYIFINWSDGVTDNPRQDTNVQKAIEVTANFQLQGEEEEETPPQPTTPTRTSYISGTRILCTDPTALNYTEERTFGRIDNRYCNYPEQPPQPTCPYPTEYIGIYSQNNPEQVKLLEKYLNTYENANIPVDGIYSWSDYQTVIKWQEKYPTEVLKPWNLKKGTGWVYISSLQKIRKVVEEGCLLG